MNKSAKHVSIRKNEKKSMLYLQFNLRYYRVVLFIYLALLLTL